MDDPIYTAVKIVLDAASARETEDEVDLAKSLGCRLGSELAAELVLSSVFSQQMCLVFSKLNLGFIWVRFGKRFVCFVRAAKVHAGNSTKNAVRLSRVLIVSGCLYTIRNQYAALHHDKWLNVREILPKSKTNNSFLQRCSLKIIAKKRGP